MAIYTHFSASPSNIAWQDLGLVAVLTTSSTFIDFEMADGTVLRVSGSGFRYSQGVPTGGTVTSVSHRSADRSTVYESITGVSIPLLTLIDAPTGADFFNLLMAGNDTLTGYAGDDWLLGGNGADTLNGAGGFDIADYATATSDIIANLADSSVNSGHAGGDSYNSIEGIWGSQFGDALTGDANANSLFGWLGSDVLDGGAGADALVGGAGDDTYVVDDAGDLVLELAGEGTDTIRTALSVYTLGADNVENLTFTGFGSFTASGNGFANVITGGDGNDALSGGAGNDILAGGAGDDELFGDAGFDSFSGGDGNDTIHADSTEPLGDGGAGFDSVYIVDDGDVRFFELGARGIEWMQSGGGDDDIAAYTQTAAVTIYGGDGNDTLRGSAYNDILSGEGGKDSLGGGDGDDILFGDGGGDIIDGGAGSDTIYAYSTDAFVDGGMGFDYLYIVDNGDVYFSNPYHRDALNGIEWVQSGGGNDILLVYEISANVTVYAGDGNDTVGGGFRNDALFGQGGNDNITGYNGDDVISGGEGDDDLDVNFLTQFVVGTDTLVGGPGDDTYGVDYAGDVVTELAGEGIDTVETSLKFYQLGDNVENLAFVGTTSLNVPNVGFGNFLDNVLTGNSGTDSLLGNFGKDTFVAGAGDDYLYIDHFDTVIDAGSGYDAIFIQDDAGTILDVGAGSAEWVYAWIGNDILDASGAAVSVTLVGEAGADALTGSAHNDYLYIDAFDTVDAGDGYDALFVYQGSGQGAIDTTIDVSAANAEWALGGAGNDTITNAGDSDSVALSGGDGNDTITGGLANDYLYGNAGADTFVATGNAQLDAILDFEAGVDKVDLTAIAGIADFAALLAAATESEGTTLLDLGGGNQLMLYQVPLASLNAGDFIFAS